MAGSVTGFGASRAWTRTLVKAIIVNGIFGWCLVWADNIDLGSDNMTGFRIYFTLDDGAV
jgi:hypothetical protein